MFKIGDAVEFKSVKSKKWFPCVIVNVDDVSHYYDVERPKGEIITGLGESLVREPKAAVVTAKVTKRPRRKGAGKTTVITTHGTTVAEALAIHEGRPFTKPLTKKQKKVIAEGGVTSDKVAKIDQVSVNSLSGQLHDDFQFAFNWFNERLFDGVLNKPFWVTVRKRNVLAHYGAKRWASNDVSDRSTNRPKVVDEMGINPDYMVIRGAEDFLSSVVHEMCHQWQHHHGENCPKSNHHNEEWGAKMEEFGLVPSSTGAEGGKKTGSKMDHYIVDGLFRQHCKELLENGFALRWVGAVEEFHGAGVAFVPGVFGIEDIGEKPKPSAKKATRAKFVCTVDGCKENAMAKPSARLACGVHMKEMEAVG